MKTIAVQQGSPEWLQARAGIPSASSFGRIIQPVDMGPSKSQDWYVAHLAAEWFLDRPCEDQDITEFMQRGKDLEEPAVGRYEFDTGLTTAKVGFITTDDGEVGASPDRLVGDDGCAEFKCPGIDVHMQTLLNPRPFAVKHRCQAQGQLYVTGRRWVDLFSYHPLLPPVCVRIERDSEFQVALSFCLEKFLTKLRAAKERLGPLRERRLEAQAAAMAEAGDGQEMLI